MRVKLDENLFDLNRILKFNVNESFRYSIQDTSFDDGEEFYTFVNSNYKYINVKENTIINNGTITQYIDKIKSIGI